MATWLFPLLIKSSHLRQGLVAVVLGWCALSVQAQDNDVSIVESDINGLTLLLIVPEPVLQAVPGTDDYWYQVELPNMAVARVPGQPALPQQ